MARSSDGTGNRDRHEDEMEDVVQHNIELNGDAGGNNKRGPLNDVREGSSKRLRTDSSNLTSLVSAMSLLHSNQPDMVEQAASEYEQYDHQYGHVDTFGVFYDWKDPVEMTMESLIANGQKLTELEPHVRQVEPIRTTSRRVRRKLDQGNNESRSQSQTQSSTQSLVQSLAQSPAQTRPSTMDKPGTGSPMGYGGYGSSMYHPAQGPMGSGGFPSHGRNGPMYPPQHPMGHMGHGMSRSFGNGRYQKQRGRTNRTGRSAPATPSSTRTELAGSLGRYAVHHENAGNSRRKFDQVTDRKRSPPWVGVVKMTSKGQKSLQIEFGDIFRKDHFDKNNICAKCGHFSHWLSDCAFPDDSGFMYGCPVHNSRIHGFDDCPDLHRLTEDDILWFLVVLRGNKAPLRTTMFRSARLRAAIDDGTWGRFDVPLPLTRSFVLDLVGSHKGRHNWLDFNYARQSNRDLAGDPATTGPHQRVFADVTLDQEVHQPVNRN
ncbi:hypothetical protein LZ31DRAFT_593891 [Colletotrichum somersetense]|nr:hypothetical protein LZ31DRAFT_593891 [Colletotrichum somersetense]